MKKALLVVLAIALFFRVFDLNLYPSGFTPDEASFGYDAYSILKTGKDQWGHVFPLVLESFGDFKAPLYSYISIPFVAVFGLTKFAIRLPNALVGVLAVYATYLLTKELLMNEKWLIANGQSSKSNKNIPKLTVNYELFAIFSSFLLAVSPWHFMMSRGAFEANLTTFLLPLGIYLFLKGLKKPKLLNYSALIFGLNLFSYHSARFVTPLLVFILAILFVKELVKLGFGKVLYPTLIFSLFVFLTAFTFFQGSGRRINDVSIASGALESQAQGRLQAINSGTSPLVAKLFHNKYLVIADRFIFNYKNYLSGKFIFKEGPGETTYGMIPGIPLMYLWEVPLLLGFIITLVKNIKSKVLVFVLSWIFIGFIPVSLTTGVGRAANRAEVVLPSLQIASGLGALAFYYLFKKEKSVNFVLGVFVLFILVSLVFTYKHYQVSSLRDSARGMSYGNSEMANFVVKNYTDSKIVISRGLSEPHIYIAFASKWDPGDYQNESKKWAEYKDKGFSFLDQLGTYSLGGYVFTDFKYKDYVNAENTLLVGRPTDFPSDVNPLKKFNYPNGEDAIYIVNPNKQAYAKAN